MRNPSVLHFLKQRVCSILYCSITEFCKKGLYYGKTNSNPLTVPGKDFSVII